MSVLFTRLYISIAWLFFLIFRQVGFYTHHHIIVHSQSGCFPHGTKNGRANRISWWPCWPDEHWIWNNAGRVKHDFLPGTARTRVSLPVVNLFSITEECYFAFRILDTRPTSECGTTCIPSSRVSLWKVPKKEFLVFWTPTMLFY